MEDPHYTRNKYKITQPKWLRAGSATKVAKFIVMGTPASRKSFPTRQSPPEPHPIEIIKSLKEQWRDRVLLAH
jgi:hypothetical protein